MDKDLQICRFHIGIVHLQLNDLEKAIDCFYEVLLFIKRNANVYMARGIAHQKQGKHDYALSDYNKAIEIDPYFAEAHLQKGFLKLQMKKHAECVADFQ